MKLLRRYIQLRAKNEIDNIVYDVVVSWELGKVCLAVQDPVLDEMPLEMAWEVLQDAISFGQSAKSVGQV